ncbi:SH3 domain-containing protein [Coralliovum pocilloporae]|uniref:SH3 domain-containing protein n=1 Tax=Coralliovum pocilloporae TaxID=3066369 RepID=UPI0033072DF8
MFCEYARKIRVAHLLAAGSLCLLSALSFTLPAAAQQLDVPVIEHADGDFDTCGLGQVKGLKANGDGFLAVRSGPGSSYKKLDELHNGDRVWLFDQKGKWLGVVYDVNQVDCSPISEDRPVRQKGKKGWIHSNWVKFLAG